MKFQEQRRKVVLRLNIDISKSYLAIRTDISHALNIYEKDGYSVIKCFLNQISPNSRQTHNIIILGFFISHLPEESKMMIVRMRVAKMRMQWFPMFGVEKSTCFTAPG